MNTVFFHFFSSKLGRLMLSMIIAVLGVAIVLSWSGSHRIVRAGTVTVDTLKDESDGSCSDDCSLRDAIAIASTGDTIDFSVTGSIVLSNTLGQLSIVKNLTLAGPQAGHLTIDGNSLGRVLWVDSGITLNVRDITIANGKGDQGGGIYNKGSINLTDTTFSHNHADAGQSYGGAIYNDSGTLLINSSTFFSNTATSMWSYGGAIYNLSGVLFITNTTFASNAANSTSYAQGGCIFNDGGTITVTNVTFSGNSARDGGSAIKNQSGSVTLRNTIVDVGISGMSCNGTITNGGNNIDSLSSCGWGSSSGSMSNTDPKLAPLANNGGQTQCYALLRGSPAIDAVIDNAPNGCPITDQRGWRRPIDGNQDGSAACDIGSYEYPRVVFLPIVLR
jgi:CSLREA domain-containing protein